MLIDKNVRVFLEELASRAPVPGGGSVAALSASLASALTEMVANLTIGRKGFEEVEEEMKRISQESSNYREKFLKDIDKDAEAFDKVMGAFKLPKNTPEEIENRKQIIQKEFKNAALVPLEVAKDAVKLMEFTSKVVEKGNKNAISDGAVATMMARTAVLGALYNVKINLQSIKDEYFVSRISKQVHELELKAIEEEKKILSKVGL
ncbi:MAG: methenyltetrahydrofolate cyclohydrolase [Candidatus Infernicultor aquiphilus]|uniref:Methenyltetrahydrofolate cyclohydrolase n=1 Tax=Candidatus Infernicultor aquiphilus TaxID=1805029 RepID=A0A2M7KB46_9BACT|nr:MAG: methenyltetrahydrofolate cyclohydrolase [Candidatus Atribacteria bacterium CG08_land_8_20_14_0_20_33_29]PIW12397.1 MAG: methenyltetrahydrofolate cyclohydrolase [Candidatus Atribacteria bacterium CG17_big_fil_post_rev_8_21_14_2_50_34_11]PIX35356.1 MAG: methenyltetrahydrofolate cyclohydrolase [Candidatus Atribacteria bacterium CG_4_8_14_3_um_filter_34_18]PIY31598.1 MAG: methenyltetrahydrofolate cyclohydrolase [Candidatus Atribacteria bacterium CG_4_10_14_3_um_filter_34_13]